MLLDKVTGSRSIVTVQYHVELNLILIGTCVVSGEREVERAIEKDREGREGIEGGEERERANESELREGKDRECGKRMSIVHTHNIIIHIHVRASQI